MADKEVNQVSLECGNDPNCLAKAMRNLREKMDSYYKNYKEYDKVHNEIRYKLQKVCTHQWGDYTRYSQEESGYICKICEKYK